MGRKAPPGEGGGPERQGVPGHVPVPGSAYVGVRLGPIQPDRAAPLADPGRRLDARTEGGTPPGVPLALSGGQMTAIRPNLLKLLAPLAVFACLLAVLGAVNRSRAP